MALDAEASAQLREKFKEWRLTDVIYNVTRTECVTWEEITGTSKQAHVARARHRVWKALRDRKKLSYPVIGKLFGVDHTTVLAAVKRLESKKNE